MEYILKVLTLTKVFRLSYDRVGVFSSAPIRASCFNEHQVFRGAVVVDIVFSQASEQIVRSSRLEN